MTDSDPATDGRAPSPDALGRALRDIIEFVDRDGWEQPPLLFALVPTAALAEEHPGLVADDDDSELSPVAQDPLPATDGDVDLGHVLATTTWPPRVAGAALVQQIVVMPPDAAADPGTAAGDGRTARLAVGALRSGDTLALLQLRPEAAAESTDDIELRTHPDLATELRAALAHTLDAD